MPKADSNSEESEPVSAPEKDKPEVHPVEGNKQENDTQGEVSGDEKSEKKNADDSKDISPKRKREELDCSVDKAKAVNKFANDGSFLAMIMQASKKPRPSSSDELKKGGNKNKEKPPQPSQRVSEEKKSKEETVDPEEKARKDAYLRAMSEMEEAGLVTEKGIGAGMVK
eukprot:GHVU01102000.1.p3 GENE.GHVU01102000.1~~GHVU01102000.1.p3  ORF type:complete len:169 (-),score=43.13 GHVU01102000.1:2030-2536(-)